MRLQFSYLPPVRLDQLSRRYGSGSSLLNDKRHRLLCNRNSLTTSSRVNSTGRQSAYTAKPRSAITKRTSLMRCQPHSSQSPSSTDRPAAITDNNPATHYIPPQKGFIASLPGSWIPYAELIRLDKPTGTYYLFFPCVFSTLIAAPMASATPMQILGTTGLFFTGACRLS